MRFLILTTLLALTFGIGTANDSLIKADLCVIEATPAGVACAIRAAREGLTTISRCSAGKIRSPQWKIRATGGGIASCPVFIDLL